MKVLRVWLLVGLFACGGRGGGGGGDEAGAVGTTQGNVSVAEFEAAKTADPEFAALVSWVGTTTGAIVPGRVGLLADSAGRQILVAELSGPSGELATVVQHCDGDKCMSAQQTLTADAAEVQWKDAAGEVQVPSVGHPFMLRIIDEADPENPGVLAPVPGFTDGTDTGEVQSALTAKADGGAIDPTRKLRLGSTFGRALTFQGPTMSDLETSMRAGGFPDTQRIFNMTRDEIDKQLSTLGLKDAFVWIAHGVANKSDKMVGMSTAWGYWLSDNYLEARITLNLGKNSSGGPGILFLAGCRTSELFPIFENGQRILLGFTGKIMPGQAYRVVQAFFDTLGAGKTLGEALDAGNAILVGTSFSLVANSIADRSLTLVTIGSFPVEFANNDGMPVHFLSGPGFGFPGTRVDAKSVSTGNLLAKPETFHTFRAGRNGAFLTGEVSCYFDPKSKTNTGTRRVVFGGGALSCVNW